MQGVGGVIAVAARQAGGRASERAGGGGRGGGGLGRGEGVGRVVVGGCWCCCWKVGCVWRRRGWWDGCESVCARCVAMCCSSSSSSRERVWVWCCRVRYLAAAAMLAGRQTGWLLALRLSRSGSRSLRESTALSKTLRLGSGPRREEERSSSTGPFGWRKGCVQSSRRKQWHLWTHSSTTINSTIIYGNAQCRRLREVTFT